MRKIKTWHLVGVTGLVLIGVGIFAFINPLSAYIKLVKFSGVALLLNSVLLLVASVLHFRSARERRWMQAESIVDALFGILLLFNPLLSFIVFPFLIGRWILCAGLLKVAIALTSTKRIRGWGYILVMGLLSCVFGLLIMYVPYFRADGVTILLGIFGLMAGTLTIFDAYRFRNSGDTLDVML